MIRLVAPLFLVVGLALLGFGAAGYVRQEGRKGGASFYVGLALLGGIVLLTLLLV